MNRYPAGNLIRVATYTGTPEAPDGGFQDSTGNLTDPTVVTLQYRPGPDSDIVSVTYPAPPVVRDGTGLYHADLDTTDAAVSETWTYEWSGTGALQAAQPNAFIVTVAFL